MRRKTWTCIVSNGKLKGESFRYPGNPPALLRLPDYDALGVKRFSPVPQKKLALAPTIDVELVAIRKRVRIAYYEQANVGAIVAP